MNFPATGEKRESSEARDAGKEVIRKFHELPKSAEQFVADKACEIGL